MFPSRFRILALVNSFMFAGSVVSSLAQLAVLDTFGPGDTYGTPGSAPIQNTTEPPAYRAYAVPFTPSVSLNLEQLTLATFLSFGPDSMTVQVVADSSGLPTGAVLESFSRPMSVGLQTFGSVSHPLLSAGTTYWVAVLPGASGTGGGWYLGDSGVFGAIGQNAGAGWSTTTTVFPAVRVEVVPELQRSTWIATLGLLGFGIWRRVRQ
jgi:hypothetical protein